MDTLREMLYLTVEVSRLVRQNFEQAIVAAGLDVTPGDARTMRYVEEFPGLKQNVLAEIMGVEPMTLVGSLDRLQTRGLVVRSADQNDRRAKLVHLTAAALPLARRLDEIAARVRRNATADLDKQAVEDLRSGLLAMRETLLSMEKQVSPALPDA